MRDVTPSGIPNISIAKFLLTRPMRDVTVIIDGKEVTAKVSTHTPHAGRDRYILCFH